MIIIGLTGGIASGKSLVARTFKDCGAHVIDADKIVHELLEPGQTGWKEVVEHFGDEILTADRSIDRKKLGAIVFEDPEKREWLNRCLHPKVFEAYFNQVNRVRARDPHAVVVLDAALLIETGYHKQMDKVVVVSADDGQQLERLLERDRFTREHALARIRSQLPIAEKKKHADYVIDNGGTRENTERQAKRIFEELKCQAREKE